MDIGAYVQIENLQSLLYSTGIGIPRLRGLRLMALERPYTDDEVNELIHDNSIDQVKMLVEKVPAWSYNSGISEWSNRKEKLCRKYITFDSENYPNGIRWENIHGKRRKTAKFAIKNVKKRIMQSVETFNKYAGRKDVLCVHARIGGNNWAYWGGPEITEHPAFIEKIDDWYDSTYCDMFLKIDPALTEKYLQTHKEDE